MTLGKAKTGEHGAQLLHYIVLLVCSLVMSLHCGYDSKTCLGVVNGRCCSFYFRHLILSHPHHTTGDPIKNTSHFLTICKTSIECYMSGAGASHYLPETTCARHEGALNRNVTCPKVEQICTAGYGSAP